MPIFRYFVVVGLALTGVLFASDYMLAPPAPVAVSSASAPAEPVKDTLYFWREAEARKRAPVNHQFTVIPQTAIALGSGIAVEPSAIQTAASSASQTSATELSSREAKPAQTVVAKVEKPKKSRRSVAQRQPSESDNVRLAYQRQQEWMQQQRFRQANASMPFGSRSMFPSMW